MLSLESWKESAGTLETQRTSNQTSDRETQEALVAGGEAFNDRSVRNVVNLIAGSR